MIEYRRVEGVKTCDYCVLGNHGRCYRVICKCPHTGWVRDPNAQVPHGESAGWSKEIKYYDKKGKIKNRIDDE